MHKNGFEARLAERQILMGFNNCIPHTGVLEILAPGWDYVWLDGQHGYHDINSLHNAILACKAYNVASLVRVPGHGEAELERICDLAPDGLLVPMVDSREQAREILQHIHFPPVGNRSYGGRRVYDTHGSNMHKDYRSFTLLQIETPTAVDNADAIASLDGVDGLFVGPDDMKIRMGLTQSDSPFTTPELRACLERVIAACAKHGKVAAIPAIRQADAVAAKEMGFRILVGGADAYYLRTQNKIQQDAHAAIRAD